MTVQVKLSKEEAAWLAFIAETEGGSPASFLRESVRGFVDSENAHCLDPTQNAFRAWLLKREGKTSNARCGNGRPLCRACAASLAEARARIAEWKSAEACA
jgi:hypothetical protein